MPASITVLNRDQSLPPLLLPNLNFVSISYNSGITDPVNCYSNTRKRNLNDLDNLATIATKRAKQISNTSSIASITPPPILSLQNGNVNSTIINTVAVASNMTSPINQRNVFTPSPTPSVSNSVTSSTSTSMVTANLNSNTNTGNNTGAKRQRIGPSCDKCRLKKIKCDAKIEILTQNDLIIPLISNKLHYILSYDDILQNLNVLYQLNISNDVINSIQQESSGFSLIKHIDKLILFKPCLSCCKRKNSNNSNNNNNTNGTTSPTRHTNNNNNDSNNNDITTQTLNNSASKNMASQSASQKKNINSSIDCKFSKGFTRADINIFNKILRNVKDKTIFDIDINDYKSTGL